MSTPQYRYTATIPPEDGTPEDDGAVSHAFIACNEDLARELCAAQGWRYDGEARPLEPLGEKDNADDWKKEKPAKPAKPKRGTRRDPAAKPQSYANPILTKNQIQAMAITARQAFDHLDGFGLIEVEGKSKTARFNAWRAMICKEVTGAESFREVRNGHYRALRAEFLKLAGKPFDEPQTMARGPQSANRADTMEAREQMMDRISTEMAAHRLADHENAGVIGEAYLMAEAKRKNPKTTLSDFASLIALPAKRLEDLFFHVRNRIAAKEGRGMASNRNKKQKGDDK